MVKLREEITFDQAATIWVNLMTVMMLESKLGEGTMEQWSRTLLTPPSAKSSSDFIDRTPLINIVRSASSVEGLRTEGAEHTPQMPISFPTTRLHAKTKCYFCI